MAKVKIKVKSTLICEVCLNPILKDSSYILIKDHEFHPSVEKYNPYKKARHTSCLICLVCKESCSHKNFRFVGDPAHGIGYCQDSCRPGSQLWLESDLGKNSPFKKFYENTKTVEQVERVKVGLDDLISKNTHPVKGEQKEILTQLLSSNDKKTQRKLRRQLRKSGVFISQLKKKPEELSKKKSETLTRKVKRTKRSK